MAPLSPRRATSTRTTRETDTRLTLDLDGEGRCAVSTGIGMYDHLLTTLAFHTGLDLELECRGDLHVDDHHTVEDSALLLGRALDQALGDRTGIARFGFAYAPLDEALARAVVDCSGRPSARVALGLRRDMLGTLAAENVAHALQTLATNARLTVHIDVLEGANDHHRAEAAFKALALALRMAVSRSTRVVVPSIKGALT